MSLTGPLSEQKFLLPQPFYPKLSLTTALEILRNHTIDVCDINPNSRSIVKLKDSLIIKNKIGISISETLFGELISSYNSIPISIKIFPDDNTDINILGLHYEVNVYKKIMSQIISHNYSPNFVGYIASSCCHKNDVIPYISISEIKYHPNNFFDTHTSYCLLITEQIGNGAYFGYNNILPVRSFTSISKELSDLDFQMVLFQVVYGIELLQRFRIVHNDLHTNNILIMILPEKVRMKFTINNTSYIIYTKYIPYIFDWDWSYCESLGDNPKLNSPTIHTDIIKGFSEKRDLYTLLCTLNRKNDLTKQYYSSLNTAKEKNKYFNIPLDIAFEIQKLPIYYTFRSPTTAEDINTYKLNKTQIQSLLGNLPEFENAITVIIELTPDPKNKYNYLLKLYNPYSCRITTYESTFPIPLEFLKTKFYNLRGNVDCKFNYILPETQTPKLIYLDPKRNYFTKKVKGAQESEMYRLNPQTPQEEEKIRRDIIKAEIVRPKLKTGYVKTKDTGLSIRSIRSKSTRKDAVHRIKEDLNKAMFLPKNSDTQVKLLNQIFDYMVSYGDKWVLSIFSEILWDIIIDMKGTNFDSEKYAQLLFPGKPLQVSSPESLKIEPIPRSYIHSSLAGTARDIPELPSIEEEFLNILSPNDYEALE